MAAMVQGLHSYRKVGEGKMDMGSREVYTLYGLAQHWLLQNGVVQGATLPPWFPVVAGRPDRINWYLPFPPPLPPCKPSAAH